MHNPGNFCYQHALLQLLASCDDFLDTLVLITGSPNWLHSFVSLLQNMRHEDNLSLTLLSNFRSQIFAPFNNGLQHDVSEFLITILEASSSFLLQTSNLLYGSLITTTTCRNCRQTTQRSETFRVLVLPIPDPPFESVVP
jgi:ubiquitin C-terminal hydrolase